MAFHLRLPVPVPSGAWSRQKQYISRLIHQNLGATENYIRLVALAILYREVFFVLVFARLTKSRRITAIAFC